MSDMSGFSSSDPYAGDEEVTLPGYDTSKLLSPADTYPEGFQPAKRKPSVSFAITWQPMLGAWISRECRVIFIYPFPFVHIVIWY